MGCVRLSTHTISSTATEGSSFGGTTWHPSASVCHWLSRRIGWAATAMNLDKLEPWTLQRDLYQDSGHIDVPGLAPDRDDD